MDFSPQSVFSKIHMNDCGHYCHYLWLSSNTPSVSLHSVAGYIKILKIILESIRPQNEKKNKYSLYKIYEKLISKKVKQVFLREEKKKKSTVIFKPLSTLHKKKGLRTEQIEEKTQKKRKKIIKKKNQSPLKTKRKPLSKLHDLSSSSLKHKK